MKQCYLWIIISTILSPIFAQHEKLSEALINKGFENVYNETYGGTQIWVYENKIFRSELKAMKVFLNILKKNSSNIENARLIPLNRGIPIGSFEYTQNRDSWNVSQISLSPDFQANSPENTSFSFLPVKENWRDNLSYGKWELTFIPDVRARFHTNEGFIRLKVNAIVEGAITLGRGLKVFTQSMFPLFYQFDKDIAEIKPGSNYLNYTVRLKNNLWVSSSAGMFHWKSGNYKDDLSGSHLGLHEWYRYGVSLETVKYFSNGKYSIFLKTDLTGHLSYQKSKWFYSSFNDRFTWFVGASYRFDYPDLYVQAGWGKDLYNNIPLEFKIVRSFRELDLGVFLVWNNQDAIEAYSGGASISIPLPYFNIKKSNTLISTSKRFDWFIWYHSGFGGRYPKAKNSINSYQKRLFPAFVNNNQKLIEGVH
ncbi:MAG: hypothetical protein CMG69_03780 [Candidatus Marinimicrobia bacterium]|nr:hypothetical protein [Candidatus Neomarinimicrobiota bacterium]|tara:strand:- start:82762 stop:84030 length:1269 start_codon:yes stop_codon:yes gene_type:complete